MGCLRVVYHYLLMLMFVSRNCTIVQSIMMLDYSNASHSGSSAAVSFSFHLNMSIHIFAAVDKAPT